MRVGSRAGCYAEYIAVPERALFALPPEADLEADRIAKPNGSTLIPPTAFVPGSA